MLEIESRSFGLYFGLASVKRTLRKPSAFVPHLQPLFPVSGHRKDLADDLLVFHLPFITATRFWIATACVKT